ncbi:MAG: hypothetical protein ACHRHE_01990 [Tepidisphaerales bacterium]
MILASLPIILSILLAAVGFGAWWVGWHGRLVDKHPRCRKCSYDLTNRPEDQQRCPECGAWIMARGAIRYGTYAMRPWLALGGLLAMAAGLFCSATSFLIVTRWLDLNEYLPTAWVVRDMWLDDRAGSMIVARLAAGKLSTSQVAAIVDQIMERQADPKADWHTTWGAIVETAQTMDLLDKPRWERYVRQALPIEIRVRERVRKGDPVPLEVDFGEVRAAAGCWPGLIWSGTAEHKAIEGGPADAVIAFDTGVYPRWGMEALLPTSTKAWASIAPGRETVTVKETITLAGSPLTFRQDKFVKLLPANQPSAKAVDRPDLHDTISGGITATISRYPGIEFQVRRAPVDLAFEVVLRSGQREWPVGQFTVSSHGKPAVVMPALSVTWPSLNVQRVDIVLRPSAAAAASTVDMTEYWNGEIVQEVEWPEEVRRKPWSWRFW